MQKIVPFAISLLSLTLIVPSLTVEHSAAQSLAVPSPTESLITAQQPGGSYSPPWRPDASSPLHNASSPFHNATPADSIASIIENNDILAFYGHPNSREMGILGRYSKDELKERLTTLAAEYDEANGPRGVIKALYLIYGTVWPEGEIGIMKDELVKEYIDYAADNDMIVFIDHQIGRFDPVASLRKMLPWLSYPNVHLALDPEWRTTRPMKEIGSVTGKEINGALQAMEEYMKLNRIAGERLMVVHQFNSKMISGRGQVTDNRPQVRLIHCADGFGSPAQKRASYAYNAQADNIPAKGFKLFYNFGIRGAGYDSPLLTPAEVCALSPRPVLIMYQ